MIKREQDEVGGQEVAVKQSKDDILRYSKSLKCVSLNPSLLDINENI